MVEANDEGHWATVFSWIERTIGGQIVRRERQGRDSGGRPAWFVDVETDEGRVRTYLRGTRDPAFSYTRVYSTEREARILQVLHSSGIPVPEVLGFHSDPAAALLAHVDGRDNFNEITDEGERDAVAEHFIELLAQVHSLDAERFEGAGLRVPRTPNEIGLSDLDVWQSTYEEAIRQPLPLLTFGCRWLRRNVPERRIEPVLVQGDTGPGNFLFEGNRVTALVDWELAHLGDPMDDLACVRSRDLYYPIGRFSERLDRYQVLSGQALDLEALRFYTVKCMLLVPLSLAPVMENLTPRTEHAEWIAQHVFYLRTTAESLAEAIGVELKPYTVPAMTETRHRVLYDIVLENLENEQLPAVEDSFRASRLALTARLVRHLRHVHLRGSAFEEQELEEMEILLGSRPANVQEGQQALDRFVREAGPERDAQLVGYFHRYALREEALMEGALGMVDHRPRLSALV
ncbi:phosphotransferase family protein [Myxococcota bacterium]|nr:phosphotransferase family protein [Myxococcota bacterium]